MLGCIVKGYKRSCSPTTGGAGRLLVGDANDIEFTTQSTGGEDDGYDAVAKRGGSGATATASLNANVVDSITVGTGGTGYLSGKVTVELDGGGGNGATAEAVVVAGVITAINVTNGGTGYGTPPTVIIHGEPDGPVLFEVDSLTDSISIDVDQSNADGSVSAWEYTISAKLAQWKQQMTNFNKRLDAAASCCELVFLMQLNDGTWLVAGEKYVDGNKIVPFKLRQDGSKIYSGLKFTDPNGQDLSIKGTYSRPPYEFIGGTQAVDALVD